MMNNIVCTNCGRPYPDEGAPYRCLVCRSHFDYVEPPVYTQAGVDARPAGIWRYASSFGLAEGSPEVTLGEGGTPLVWAEAFGREVAFKLEFLNPTGSFKDRGTAPLVSFLKSRGVQAAVEDSSGNAGASFAAYSARAGIHARIYVPDSASGPKRTQISAYGAEVIAVPGSRTQVSDAAQQDATDGGVYASHAYLPFNLLGYATLAYELVEQLGQAPGSVVIPVGQGGLMLGTARGFAAMQAAGVIPSVPQLYGVQARACAPLWALSSYGADGLMWVTEGETAAEGVRVSRPVRGDAVLQAVEASGGGFLAVDEEEILAGRDQLARRGLYVEATSALVWNGLGQLQGHAPGPVVAVLTGSGLKNPVQ